MNSDYRGFLLMGSQKISSSATLGLEWLSQRPAAVPGIHENEVKVPRRKAELLGLQVLKLVLEMLFQGDGQLDPSYCR